MRGATKVQDNRRSPFFIVEQRHTAILREHFTGERRRMALAIYATLCELANEERSLTLNRTRSDIAELAGVSVRSLDAVGVELVECGLLLVERQKVGALNLPNVWTLLDGLAGGGAPGALVQAVREGGAPDDTPRAHQTSELQEELQKESPPIPPASYEARLRVGGRPVNPDLWDVAVGALAAFNAATGNRLEPLSGRGQPSESAKMIYGRVADYPEMTVEDHAAVIASTLANPWWSTGPATVGVVYSPKAWEQNLQRATVGNVRQTRLAHSTADLSIYNVHAIED